MHRCKPDAVQRGLVGDIIARFEKRGYKLVGLKMMAVSEDLAKNHYSDLSGRPFFPDLVKFICSSPVVAMCMSGCSCFLVRMAPLSRANTRA